MAIEPKLVELPDQDPDAVHYLVGLGTIPACGNNFPDPLDRRFTRYYLEVTCSKCWEAMRVTFERQN